MSDQAHPRDSVDPAAAAAYITDLLADLAAMARRHRFDALSFLIDMARLEAQNLSRSADGRPSNMVGRG